MKKHSCFWIIIVSVFTSWANTDSLVYKLNDKSFKIRKIYPDSSLYYAEKAYTLSLEMKNLHEEMRSLNNIANHYRIVNEHEKAIAKFNETLKLAQHIKDVEFKAKILNNIGLTYKSYCRYDSAIMYFHKAIETNNSNSQKKFSLHNIGVTYRDLGEFNQAIEAFHKCIEVYITENDTLGIAKIKNSIGNVYYDQGIYDTALTLYKEYLKLIPDNYLYKKAIAFSNIGATYEGLNKLDSAFFFIQKALNLSKEMEDDLGVVINLSNAGNILRKQNKQLAALQLYNQAIALADSIGFKDKKQQILLSISKTYSELKQFEQSLYYYEQYHLLKDSLQSAYTDEIIAKEEQRYRAAERENEIIKLKAENDEKKLQQKASNRLIVAIIVFAIMISVFVYFIIGERNKKRKLENEQRVVHSMLDAEEKTKAEISQEIHDNLGTRLSMASTSIGAFKKFVPDEQYTNVKEMLLEAQDISRSISHKLFSSFLRDMGLPAAVKKLLDDLNNVKGKRKYYFHTNLEENQRLDWDVELNLFRITQELVNNCIKYAEADRVDIEIENDQGKINYFYQDNGKGFVYETVKKGVGLQSICNRATHIGMNAFFDSTPNKGTKVTIS